MSETPSGQPGRADARTAPEAAPAEARRLGFKPKNSAGRDLKKAVAVGVGLGLLVLFAALTGPFAWYPLVAAAAGLATWEVCSRLREHGYVVHRVTLIVGGQVMLWASWPFGVTGIATGFVAAALVVMFGRLFHRGRNHAPENYLRDTGVSIFVLTWVPLFAAFAAMISRLGGPHLDAGAFIITFVVCVIASDTGGYVTGVLFGSHPLAPAVSPNKSVEGFVGSVVWAAVAGTLLVCLLFDHAWYLGLALGALMAVCATLGDLVESQFKRDLKIKDMSGMLPGHGGLMDRLDGLLPAAMVSWLLLSVVA